ncbi:hypothetical protein [Lyngbya confervoides]|uniref:Uncharacterized protein n=1 Tax=Lyngbya confervoides BDU141951 TaxID=1574623 RepID=A0ABD4T1D1_9CYAN|nr:hypothetical protein [Lyngbya confervoides]MCM1982456.1 hypothetical protein [Lyngbya confervoides BDU141951]
MKSIHLFPSLTGFPNFYNRINGNIQGNLAKGMRMMEFQTDDQLRFLGTITRVSKRSRFIF